MNWKFWKKKKQCCGNTNVVYGNPKYSIDAIKNKISEDYDVRSYDYSFFSNYFIINFFDEEYDFIYKTKVKTLVPAICKNCGTIFESGAFENELQDLQDFIYNEKKKHNKTKKELIKRDTVDKLIELELQKK